MDLEFVQTSQPLGSATRNQPVVMHEKTDANGRKQGIKSTVPPNWPNVKAGCDVLVASSSATFGNLRVALRNNITVIYQ